MRVLRASYSRSVEVNGEEVRTYSSYLAWRDHQHGIGPHRGSYHDRNGNYNDPRGAAGVKTFVKTFGVFEMLCCKDRPIVIN